jgi:hypothetical protein
LQFRFCILVLTVCPGPAQAMIGVLSIPMILGLLTTFLLPETGNHQSLDQIQEKVENIVKKRELYQQQRKGLEPVPSTATDSVVHNWVPPPPTPPFGAGSGPPPGYQSPGGPSGSTKEALESHRSGLSMSPPPLDLHQRHSGHSSSNLDVGHVRHV